MESPAFLLPGSPKSVQIYSFSSPLHSPKDPSSLHVLASLTYQCFEGKGARQQRQVVERDCQRRVQRPEQQCRSRQVPVHGRRSYQYSTALYTESRSTPLSTAVCRKYVLTHTGMHAYACLAIIHVTTMPGKLPYIPLAHGNLVIVTIRIFPSAHHFRT